MNYFMIDENANNEINAVYDIGDIRDLHKSINDAVELSKDLETDAETDTHFICGSLFGLIPINNRLMSSFQLMVSFLWHQKPSIYANENKHMCTFLRGSRGFAKTRGSGRQNTADSLPAGDEWMDPNVITNFMGISEDSKNFLFKKRPFEIDFQDTSSVESVGDDLESFSQYLKQYFDRTNFRDTSMNIASTFLLKSLTSEQKPKDFEAEFQLFLNDQTALMNTQYFWQRKQNFIGQLVTNVNRQIMQHICITIAFVLHHL